MAKDVGEWWTTFSMVSRVHNNIRVCALQDTVNLNVTGVEVPEYVCYDWDAGQTTFFVPQAGLPGTSLVGMP